MNLVLFGRVLWRQKLLMTLGVIVAVVLATLSAYRVDDGDLVARSQSKYQSHVQLVVSSLSPFQTDAVRTVTSEQQLVQGLQASQMAGAYPYIIVTDEFAAQVSTATGLPKDSFEISSYRRTTAPGVEQNATLVGDNNLPVMEIDVTAASPEAARKVADVAVATLSSIVVGQQESQGIAPEQRVDITALSAASPATVVGKSPTLLMGLVFVAVIVLFFAMAFSSYNVRMNRRAAQASVAGEPAAEGASEKASHVDVEAVDEAEGLAAQEPEDHPAPAAVTMSDNIAVMGGSSSPTGDITVLDLAQMPSTPADRREAGATGNGFGYGRTAAARATSAVPGSTVTDDPTMQGFVTGGPIIDRSAPAAAPEAPEAAPAPPQGATELEPALDEQLDQSDGPVNIEVRPRRRRWIFRR